MIATIIAKSEETGYELAPLMHFAPDCITSSHLYRICCPPDDQCPGAHKA